MYHIYHTEGIVLGSRNFGETGKYYSIFTRELGMVHATASGVRKMSSKLRFILQDFAYLKVDLVEGKDFWRITSASKTNTLEKISRNPDTLKVFYNIVSLLKRLLAGAEESSLLFDDVINGLNILERAETREERENTEVIIVLRILNHLGYIGDSALENLVRSPFEQELIFEVSKSRVQLLRRINKILKETHL